MLNENERSIIKKTIELRFAGHEFQIYLFGSRIRGDNQPGSDLDVLISAARPLSFTEIAFLREDFEQSDLPFHVDIVDKHRCTNDFLERIMKEAIPL